MTTTTIDNNILEKIKQLLAMAEHEGSNEHEASLAMQRAQELLIRHNLSRADIKNEDGQAQAGGGIGKLDFVENEGYDWKRGLINTLALNNLCHLVVTPSKNQYHIFGLYDNVKVVVEMYRWLSIEIEAVAIRTYLEYKRDGGTERQRTWKTSFYTGVIHELNIRLEATLNNITDNNCKAMIVSNKNALSNALKKIYPQGLHSSRSSCRLSNDGYSSGQGAGRNIRLNQQAKLNYGRLALRGG